MVEKNKMEKRDKIAELIKVTRLNNESLSQTVYTQIFEELKGGLK